MEVSEFSLSKEKRTESISFTTTAESCTNEFSAINGYVTATYDGTWWLGCIIKTMQDVGEAEVYFLPLTVLQNHSSILQTAMSLL